MEHCQVKQCLDCAHACGKLDGELFGGKYRLHHSSTRTRIRPTRMGVRHCGKYSSTRPCHTCMGVRHCGKVLTESLTFQSRSRSPSTIFTMTPFDGKCQNLQTSFFTF